MATKKQVTYRIPAQLYTWLMDRSIYHGWSLAMEIETTLMRVKDRAVLGEGPISDDKLEEMLRRERQIGFDLAKGSLRRHLNGLSLPRSDDTTFCRLSNSLKWWIQYGTDE